MARGSLDKTRGQIAGFGQQEPANLHHMGAGGDMHQILFIFSIKRVVSGKVQQCGIYLLKIPRVGNIHLSQYHFSLRGGLLYILFYPACGLHITRLINQLEAVNMQIRLLTQPDTRPPFMPAVGFLAAPVEYRAENTNHNVFLCG